MSNLFRKAALAAIVAGGASPVLAADLAERPIVIEEPPVIQQPYEEVSDFGGWYIRGDVDYHWPDFRGADYITYGTPPGTKSFDTGELKAAFSLGAGVGYQINRHFRTDLTVDYW